MVIWARWGILGLLVPMAFIAIAIHLFKPSQTVERKPVKQTKAADDDDEEAPTEDAEELKAAARKRAVERERMVKRAEGIGHLVGALLSAAVLWPLGRWMNKSESHTLVDQQTGLVVEAQIGGGHTLFFIPMELGVTQSVTLGSLRS